MTTTLLRSLTAASLLSMAAWLAPAHAQDAISAGSELRDAEAAISQRSDGFFLNDDPQAAVAVERFTAAYETSATYPASRTVRCWTGG